MDRIPNWLPIVFHFGTENWEEQLKNHPVQDKLFLGVVANLHLIVFSLDLSCGLPHPISSLSCDVKMSKRSNIA